MTYRRILISLPVLVFLARATPPAYAQDIDLTQQVVITTSEGSFVLSLYADKAPRHVRLFLSRVAAGAYDGTSFGYVVRWGVIQGGRIPKGGAQAGEAGNSPADIRAEVPEAKHVRGTLSLVLGTNEADTGQFFICVTPQPGLDGRYVPCGFVAEGIDVIDRISEAPADARGAPIQPPQILKAVLRPARPIPQLPFADAPPGDLARYRAVLETTLGNMTIEFLPDLAPNHIRNFLRLAQAGFYDGTAFHRIVRDFVLQGGLLSTRQPPLPDFRAADLVRKLKPEFSAARHIKGIVSMARYDDPDSAETSFFICLGDAANLDSQYTIFGKVTEGADVLERFQNVAVEGEAPKERIELKKVTITRK
jgi:peptidyl-prolyl cis-trans isomerase B (cyclophilin B)